VAPATIPAVRSDGRWVGMLVLVLVGRVAAVLVMVLSFGCASGPSWSRPPPVGGCTSTVVARPGSALQPPNLGISPLTPGSALA
jgi:hypothetical protein